jgi:hypothetical protein
MKKIVFLSVVLLTFLISCTQEASDGIAEMNFKTTKEYDFGKIPYKGNAEVDFVFENTGKGTLIITNVTSSCGCTVPIYPKNPIKKGKSDKIVVKYDSERVGQFTKSVKIFSNSKISPIKLVIKGEVLSPESK